MKSFQLVTIVQLDRPVSSQDVEAIMDDFRARLVAAAFRVNDELLDDQREEEHPSSLDKKGVD